MSGTGRWSRRDLAAVAAVTLATAAVYAGLRGHDFVNYDDPDYVTRNPHVLGGLSEAGLRWGLTATHAGNWHPLTWLSHMLDVEVFGVDPGAHHLVSLALHLASAAAVFALFRGLTGATGASAFVSAAFALHPLHVESVAWVAERKDVLSGLLGLATLLAYGRYARRPSAARYAGLLVLFAAGLAAKPMLVTLPLVLLLLDFWPLGPQRRPWRRIVLEKIPLVLLAAGAGIVTLAAQHEAGALAPLEQVGLAARVAHAPVACVGYLFKTVWPAALAVPYPYPLGLPWWQVSGSIAILAAVSAVALGLARTRPYLVVGWLWYAIMVAPVIGLVQAGDQAMADRYTYLPSIGLFVMIAWSARDWAAGIRTRRAVVAAAAIAAALAMALVARRQVAVWSDTVTLFEHALRVTRGNHVAHTYLAVALDERGDTAGALRHLETVEAMGAAFADAPYTLGQIHGRRGDRSRAAGYYRQALAIEPTHVGALVELGRLLAEEGALEEALLHYERALHERPDDVPALNNAGVTLTHLGRAAEALVPLGRARALEPSSAEVLNNLGVALVDLGRLDEAASVFLSVLEREPAHVEALLNLGVCAQRAGRLEEAEARFLEVLRADPDSVPAWAALGDTRARAGDLQGAREAYAQALRAAPDAPQIREKLTLVEQAPALR